MTIPEQLRPGAVLQQRNNVRDTSAQTLMKQQVHESVPHRQLRLAEDVEPCALSAHGEQRILPGRGRRQRQNLIRGFPQLRNPLRANWNTQSMLHNLPLGVVKSHSLEITVNRRYSNGLSANLAFSANRSARTTTVEAYDREPTAWQASQDARPWRFSGGAVYELPFGGNKPFLKEGAPRQHLRRMADGRHVRISAWCVARLGTSTFLQRRPGDIPKKTPEIALQRDGTIDCPRPGSTPDGLRDSGRAPAGELSEARFPFRVDGVRGPGFFLVNMNVVRNFSIGGSRR